MDCQLLCPRSRCSKVRDYRAVEAKSMERQYSLWVACGWAAETQEETSKAVGLTLFKKSVSVKEEFRTPDSKVKAHQQPTRITV